MNENRRQILEMLATVAPQASAPAQEPEAREAHDEAKPKKSAKLDSICVNCASTSPVPLQYAGWNAAWISAT